MREAKADLTNKENWQTLSSAEIAAMFGFVNDVNFEKALKAFKKEIVEPAKLCQYLGIIAEGFFGKWQPPLTKHNGHSSY